MQTEEIVSRAQSTGIDGGPTDNASLHHHQHRSSRVKCPLPPLLHMAVKQEPQEEEERSRDTNALSPQVDADVSPTSVDGKHGHGHETSHHQIQELEESAGQTVTDLNSRGRPSRGRRKSRWKLKFHHQALPPEYLDHYEASLAQEALNSSSPTRLTEPTIPSPAPTSSTSTPSPIADVHGWLQRIAAMQQELCPRISSSQCSPVNSCQASGSRRSVITSTSTHALNAGHHNHNHGHGQQQQPLSQGSGRPPMKYSDLPYMGEITLDNSKPRRGRKPKKADICHLIYKNYGTILPGTPGHEERRLSPRDKLDCRERISPQMPFQRTDVQNRISSLLEKRLTQESRRSFGAMENSREQDEPLNLCIRDLNQLKIRLLRKHGNVYESGQVKSETSSDGEEIECIGATFPSEPGYRSLDHLGHITGNNVNHNNNNNNNNNNVIEPVLAGNPGFVYWPNAGVFIHPMALQSQLLYYQKMAQNDKCYARGLDQHPKEQKIVPKSIYSMMETKSPPLLPAAVQPASQTATVVPPPVSPRPKRNASVVQAQGQPTKRKRSAIFIPPMPSENNNNPATEVSICKFKFTGGAKPSLQEKKSLSVDSGGNFRYYSGTGDKSMRGYEFFPREALQQSAGQSGSSTGAFLNAAGEKIQPTACQRSGNQEEGRRKRKTRKSLQREKLEQTFKEKGFLIQTQQLESAEGATYCKFRQLRKFTRYLFRSWKDYLPGNVRELTGAPDNEMADGDAESDTNVLPSPVPRPNMMVDVPAGFVDEHRALPLT
ncbi:uncharacterized protein LOC117166582 isoform X3 [Bombus vancouverensis nearcticus]|nr:uncharacterized protein LOC117166582 isoform X2 [Bombus vancouverensis nearcticus]XP_033206558.1 uncharacterized protein LOC117166582 isoform X2 [Bombus vancouverensis nearcticus]XP_033206559.1 uncharacterized protein LOC117166582 isoform X2 [Bombus vancouverensis nearcticus]XP_033206560.1 uncharacterized protein LOC117166582 isoform X2 [Bombus vancouverensis nearcticus]